MFRGIAAAFSPVEKFAAVQGDDPVDALIEGSRVEGLPRPGQLVLAKLVAGFEIGEGGFPIAPLVTDFAEREMHLGTLAFRQIPVRQHLPGFGDFGLAQFRPGGGGQMVLRQSEGGFVLDRFPEAFDGFFQMPSRQQKHTQPRVGFGQAFVVLDDFPVLGLGAVHVAGLEHHRRQVQEGVQITGPATHGLLEGLLGAPPILLGLQDIAEAVVGFGRGGGKLDGLQACLLRRLQILRFAQRLPKVGPGHGVFGIQLDRRPESFLRLGHFVHAQLDVAPVDMGLDEIRFQLDGPFTGLERLVQPALDLQGHGQIIVAVRVTGPKIDDVAAGGLGFQRTAEQIHNGAAIDMDLHVLVIAGDRFQDHFAGLIQPPVPKGDQGPHVKGFGVERIQPGDLAETFFRFIQMAGLEVCLGLLQEPPHRRAGPPRPFFLFLLFSPFLAVHVIHPCSIKGNGLNNCLGRHLSLNKGQPRLGRGPIIMIRG